MAGSHLTAVFFPASAAGEFWISTVYFRRISGKGLLAVASLDPQIFEKLLSIGSIR